jgi:hypothetical protein
VTVRVCEDCKHPDTVYVLTDCPVCGVPTCHECEDDHARECHERDCRCSACMERRVCAAESLRDSMEDR